MTTRHDEGIAMTDRHSRRPERSLAVAAVGALCALASLTAGAQSSGPSAPTAPTTPSTPSASSSPLGNQLDASPYYLGASESLTHDSNVFRTPSGPSDNYSSTSLLGGFDQPIGRQRVFGTASVSLNRYQREHELNNTSYNLATGANLETIEHLSGSLNAGLGRSLSAPTANVEVPTATRNQVTTRTLDGSARWGGTSILTLEATAGWSSIDYSAPESAASESRQQRASLGLIYGPGGPLRVGVSGNFNRTKTPNAFIDPVTGAIESNTTDGKSLDLTADYQISGIVNASGRVGYTRQSSSGSSGSDFSGLTGGVSPRLQLQWQDLVPFRCLARCGFQQRARELVPDHHHQHRPDGRSGGIRLPRTTGSRTRSAPAPITARRQRSRPWSALITAGPPSSTARSREPGARPRRRPTCRKARLWARATPSPGTGTPAAVSRESGATFRAAPFFRTPPTPRPARPS